MPWHRSTLLAAGCCGPRCVVAAARLRQRRPRCSAKPSMRPRTIRPCTMVWVRHCWPWRDSNSHVIALQVLDDAAQAFQVALQRAEDQAAPRAVRLRYAINLATVEWMRGERTRDEALIKRAADFLRSVAVGLSPSSPYWAHVQDNLGNALAALGSTAEAMLPSMPRSAVAKPRRTVRGHSTTSGLCMPIIGATTGHAGAIERPWHCCPGTSSPLLWGAIQNNLATALLQATLSGKQPEREVGKLQASVAAFRSALEIRQRERMPFDWAITAVNMAGALVSLGAHLVTSSVASRRQPGLGHVHEAIGLYREALDQLADADLEKTANNVLVALQVLARLSPDDATQQEIRQHYGELLLVASRHGLSAIADEIRRITPASTEAPPSLPAGLQWPSETYAQAHKERGENIVAVPDARLAAADPGWGGRPADLAGTGSVSGKGRRQLPATP